MRALKTSDRLIVGADYRPDRGEKYQGRVWAEDQVLRLADDIVTTGVCLKVGAILRSSGYSLIEKIHSRGLKVFADLKLHDTGWVLSIDGILLRECHPEFLTVSCAAGVEGMRSLKSEVPKTEVLGVTVLTTFNDADSDAVFTCSTQEAVVRLAKLARKAGVDGLVSSPKEAEILREFGLLMSINAPAIRPVWHSNPGGHNSDRIMTPEKAIRAGADRIVVSRPITAHKRPYDAVMYTLDEIARAVVIATS